MFTIKELARWLGVTVFEIFVYLICVMVFSITVVLKLDGYFTDPTTNKDTITWWTVFVALFAGDGVNAYFCVIVFIRQCLENEFKAATFRALWSFIQLLLVTLFKVLLCLKLEEDYKQMVYSEVFTPVFILLMLVMVRACQMH